ncbi:MAG TPA: hypothetical protein PKD37_04975 [Oligoflexia bacterium]|nr:hypothetical protein [Oligoflexia bacterium]HMP27319.1 hypothetical protein [Oligoflexia bacterium]
MSFIQTGYDSKIQLIDVTIEIEVHSLNYSATKNMIFFDGLSSLGNKCVVVKYDLNSVTLSAIEVSMI